MFLHTRSNSFDTEAANTKIAEYSSYVRTDGQMYGGGDISPSSDGRTDGQKWDLWPEPKKFMKKTDQKFSKS